MIDHATLSVETADSLTRVTAVFSQAGQMTRTIRVDDALGAASASIRVTDVGRDARAPSDTIAD